MLYCGEHPLFFLLCYALFCFVLFRFVLFLLFWPLTRQNGLFNANAPIFQTIEVEIPGQTARRLAQGVRALLTHETKAAARHGVM